MSLISSALSRFPPAPVSVGAFDNAAAIDCHISMLTLLNWTDSVESVDQKRTTFMKPV